MDLVGRLNRMSVPSDTEGDPFPDLPAVVDIGGEIYSFQRERQLPVQLHLRTYEEFLLNYNLKKATKSKQQDAEQLVRAYLPYGVTRDIVTYASIPEEDRLDLVALLESRIAKIKEAVKLKRNSGQFYVRNYRDEVAANDIQKLLNFFKGLREDAAKVPPKTPFKLPEIPGYKLVKIQTPTQAAETKKRLASLSEDEKTEQILRMAFYSLHPDRLDRTILTEWDSIQEWAKKAGPSDFIEQIRQASAEAQAKAKLDGEVDAAPMELPARTLNWLSRMNYAKLESAKDESAARAAVKESLIRLESDEEKQRTQAMNSLRRILLVLAQKKYITEKNAATAGDTGAFSLEMESRLKHTLRTRLLISLTPLFETFETLYSDYYTKILEFLRPKSSQINRSTQPNIFESFLTLYNFMEDVQAKTGENGYPIQPGGLYRIDFPKNATQTPDFREFLTGIFQTLATIPTLPVKEMDPKLYSALATKDLIGYNPAEQPPIPGQTVMDAATMKRFLGLENPEGQQADISGQVPGLQPDSNPVFLFPMMGGTGATTTFYSVKYDTDPPEVQQMLVVAKSFRDLFLQPKREKMLNVEAMRLIILAMYQVILEYREQAPQHGEVPVTATAPAAGPEPDADPAAVE